MNTPDATRGESPHSRLREEACGILGELGVIRFGVGDAYSFWKSNRSYYLCRDSDDYPRQFGYYQGLAQRARGAHHGPATIPSGISVRLEAAACPPAGSNAAR